MKTFFLRIALIAAVLAVPAVLAAQSVHVGILPFDTVSVEGGGSAASQAVAKLVRIEMIKARKVLPELLTVPDGTKTPMAIEQAASVGKTAGVGLVVVGTVVQADVSHSYHGANTGGLLSSVGVGGQLQRSKATVGLHIELVDPASGKVADSFDVDAKNSDVGLGMDVSTALGSVNTGGSDWSKSPIGKALQEAAKKVSDEVAKRVPKLVH